MPVHQDARAVIEFWLREVPPEQRYARDDALDAQIARRFATMRENLLRTDARDWRHPYENVLAAIILLDQFGRNIHRGKAQAFGGDPLARDLSGVAIAAGFLDDAPAEWREFTLMPWMHSENPSHQQRSIELFAQFGSPENQRFAHLHFDQIKRFGRFPGRNAALGRVSTPAEEEALAQGAAF